MAEKITFTSQIRNTNTSTGITHDVTTITASDSIRPSTKSVMWSIVSVVIDVNSLMIPPSVSPPISRSLYWSIASFTLAACVW